MGLVKVKGSWGCGWNGGWSGGEWFSIFWKSCTANICTLCSCLFFVRAFFAIFTSICGRGLILDSISRKSTSRPQLGLACGYKKATFWWSQCHYSLQICVKCVTHYFLPAKSRFNKIWNAVYLASARHFNFLLIIIKIQFCKTPLAQIHTDVHSSAPCISSVAPQPPTVPRWHHTQLTILFDEARIRQRRHIM